MILLIETSTERGVVGVIHEGKILFEKELPFGFQNSHYLVPTIEEGLQSIGVLPEKLKAVSVGIGPGSYTGIRVGVAVAKTFSFALKIPLIGISSLLGFIPIEDGFFAALIDAKIGGVYLIKGNKSGKDVHYLTEPDVVPLGNLKQALVGVEWLVTPNSQILKTKIELDNGQKWIEIGPSLEHLAAISQQKFDNKDYSLDAKTDILYLRKTQAELEKGL